MAERFFCPDASPEATRVALEGDEARHLAKVRRVKEGEIVELFNGKGLAFHAQVVSVQKDRVLLRQGGPPLPDRIVPVSLTLATAVPKGDRFDWLIEKATELGVTRLVPIVTERSVVDPRMAKLDRLRRNVIEASKQCGRNRLMQIESTIPWKDFLKLPIENAWLCDPSGSRLPNHAAMRGEATSCVAVGPEGGFTEGEIAAARASGWTVLSLGATLLRIETAGIVACARVLAIADLESLGERNNA